MLLKPSSDFSGKMDDSSFVHPFCLKNHALRGQDRKGYSSKSAIYGRGKRGVSEVMPTVGVSGNTML